MRYWIIPVAHPKIDIQKLKGERDRIWSAAVKAYRNGEQWWLTDSEEKLSQQNNQQFQIIDEWQGAIAGYLENREQVSIMEILTKVFEIEPGKVDRRSQMRVANILTNLSWKKAGQKQHQGKRQVVWIRSIPSLNEESIAEVLQPENKIEQGLSIPTTPSVFNNKTTNIKSSKTEKEALNSNGDVSYVEGIAGAEKPDTAMNLRDYTDEKTTATPNKIEINWKNYPYNSNDVQTLKNRANKVKERVLNCTTNNQLNELLFSRGGNEIELNWLVENYFIEAEKVQLEQIQNSTQTNLFSEPKTEVIEYKFDEIKADIDAHMQRIGWSVKDGKKYLSDRYNKKSRIQLNDRELLEFWEYLKGQKGETEI